MPIFIASEITSARRLIAVDARDAMEAKRAIGRRLYGMHDPVNIDKVPVKLFSVPLLYEGEAAYLVKVP